MKKLMLFITAFIFSMTMVLSSGFAEGDSMTSEDKVKEEKDVKGDAKGKKLGHKKQNIHPQVGHKGKAPGYDKGKHKGEKSGKLEKNRDAIDKKSVDNETEKKEPEVKEPEKKEPEIKDPRDRRIKKGIQ